MDVSLGYKRTELGIIPDDWNVQSLEKSTDPLRPISYGIVQTGPNLIDGVACLRVVDVNNGRIGKTDLIRTSKKISNSYQRTVLKAGDLVMPLRGKVGDVGAVDKELEGANLTRGVALLAIRQGMSGEFCRQFISWSTTRRRLEQSMNGSALQEIPIAALRAFQVAFPKSDIEQRAIAVALGDVDALLDGLDRLVAKKRDLKQAAMQQLLTGQTRIPGFLTRWAPSTLASVIADFEAGVSVNSVGGAGSSATSEAGILKTSCVANGRFDSTEYKLIDPREVSRAKLSIKRDTIIVSRMNTPNLVGEVGYVEKDYPNLFLPDRLWMTRLKTDVEICTKWLAYVLSSTSIKRSIQELATGTSGTMKNISKRKLLELELSFPRRDEQTAIATVLSDIDAELIALGTRHTKTRALKQAMMQELLTGKTRLVPPTKQPDHAVP